MRRSFWFRKHRTNADAHRLDAIVVEVELRHILAEGLRQAVVAVRALSRGSVDFFVLSIEARNVIRTGEHDAPDVVQTRCFVEVEHALDIRFEYLFEGPLDRYATEMDDRIAPFDEPVDGGAIREIAGHHFLMRCGVARQHAGQIGNAHARRKFRDAMPDNLANTTNSARQQQARSNALFDDGAPFPCSIFLSPRCGSE